MIESAQWADSMKTAEGAQDSLTEYMNIFHRWKPQPTKKPAIEFQHNHIPVYKADIGSSMEEYWVWA